MYYDYHIHSHFSDDCKTDMEEIVEKAIEIGLKEICFTDHIDYDNCYSEKEFEFNVEEYTGHINIMRDRYGDKIKILKGIEMGIQPHIIEKCDKVIENGNFDFVISSIHTCGRKVLYNGEFYIGKSAKEAYLKYFEELLYCIKNFNNFNIIGHLNILPRYNEEVAKENLMDYSDFLYEIFKALIERNKGIEINTSSFRYSNKFLLSADVLKLYKELGGEIITIGSDSHTSDTLVHKFDYIYKLIKEIAFKYITTFEKMQPKFVEI